MTRFAISLRRQRTSVGAFSLALSLGLSGIAAHAQVAYSNLATLTGFYTTPAGASGTDNYTNLVADDITVGTGFAGLPINQIQFTLYNANAAAAAVRPILQIYRADGTGGAPGTLLYTYAPASATYAPGTLYTLSDISPTTLFTVPASGTFWVAESFGSAISTAAQLDNFGVLTYNPPTVGSSADRQFLSTTAGALATSNPAGSITTSPYGGSPVANYGFSFANAPEPDAAALILCALLPVGIGALRRRRSA